MNQSSQVSLQQNLGNFDFNTTPLAPPGYLIVAHEQAQEQGTWVDNGVKLLHHWPGKASLL